MINRPHVVAFLAVLVLATLAQAHTFTTLYDFTGGNDGGNPYAGVIQDPAGNLYGTAGGNDGYGVVYEVNTAGVEIVLHAFHGSDGAHPFAPLVRDNAGNLYGATFEGGKSSACTYGCGTVFKIDAAGTETMLHSFTGGSDGCSPFQGLVMDKAGSLYGTTSGCGSSRRGTIFKVDKAGKLSVLHTFSGARGDGAHPVYGHLMRDKSGNLYGATSVGGTSGNCGQSGCGALYKLGTNGKLTLLYSFEGGTEDGCYPRGSVVQDESGNLYGTTAFCGSVGYGIVWKVSKTGHETIPHNFVWDKSDGRLPYAGVTLDSEGDLYGVTYYGGPADMGVLYELDANGTYTGLHDFDGSDGQAPMGEVLWTSNGTLFGTTYEGGTYNYGTVWSYVP